MKRLKQVPTTIPYRNGEIKVGDKSFTLQDGNCGRYLLSEFLVNDNNVSQKIKSVPALMELRELILSQTIVMQDGKGNRLIPDSTNFYGGSAFSFDMTKEGFFIVILRNTEETNSGQIFPSDKIGGILIPSLDLVTKEGLKLLDDAGYLTEEKVEIKETNTELPEPKLNIEKFAELTSKATSIVNDKLSGRQKRASNPI